MGLWVFNKILPKNKWENIWLALQLKLSPFYIKKIHTIQIAWSRTQLVLGENQ